MLLHIIPSGGLREDLKICSKGNHYQYNTALDPSLPMKYKRRGDHTIAVATSKLCILLPDFVTSLLDTSER